LVAIAFRSVSNHQLMWKGSRDSDPDDFGDASKVVVANFRGRDLLLRDGKHFIGRSNTCQIVIDDPRISRRHARITVDGDAVTVEDLESKNGTYRNGRRLAAPERLADGDEIWIGLKVAELRFRVCDESTKTQR